MAVIQRALENIYTILFFLIYFIGHFEVANPYICIRIGL